MDSKEIEFENINNIDTDIDSRYLDDDSSFGSIKINDTDFESDSDRNFERKTGIIIDLSDDDDVIVSKKAISANLNDRNGIDVRTDFDSPDFSDNSNFNQIDMETDYFDEDDTEIINNNTKNKFDDSEKILFNNDAEELLESSNTGEVNSNYWKDLAKKHAKTNKKGAYNTHFHLSANPKAEQDFFNQSMGSITATDSDTSINTNTASGNITGTANGSCGFGESLESKSNEYNTTLNDLLFILQLKLIPQSSSSCNIIDLCQSGLEYKCNNIEELKQTLSRFMEDIFISPIAIYTNLKFSSCDDLVDWYLDEENQNKYPKFINDIKYCDLVANHLDECDLKELAR